MNRQEELQRLIKEKKDDLRVLEKELEQLENQQTMKDLELLRDLLDKYQDKIFLCSDISGVEDLEILNICLNNYNHKLEIVIQGYNCRDAY